MNRHQPASHAAPALHLAGKPRLRVLGTAISLLEELRVQAERDLGIELVFNNNDFLTAQTKAAQEPESYDIYHQCFHNLDIVWYWRAIQPIEIARIALWDEITDLTKTGQFVPTARLGHGDAPVKKLFVQSNLALGEKTSDFISMLPTTHNFDSFAYLSDVASVTEVNSWSALFDERWSARRALVDEPAIGIFDAALAAQSAGLLSFANIGNITVGEIDSLFDLLETKKRAGYFRAFWRTAEEAADLMVREQTDIQSMWSTGIGILNSAGLPVEQSVPAAGYRAWHGGLWLSRGLEGRTLDVAYDYLNWWISGWPSAVVARQGYYIFTPQRSPVPFASGQVPSAAAAPTGSGPIRSPFGTRDGRAQLPRAQMDPARRAKLTIRECTR